MSRRIALGTGCPEPGYPQLYDEIGEFGVYVVQPDGNPERDATYTSLRRALEEADALERDWRRRARENGRRVAGFVGVLDEDDPERGWLDEGDLDEGDDD